MQDSLKKAGKTLQFGLSIGLRVITDFKDVNFRNVAINPVDNTLVVDGRDPTDIVLSGMATVYPWKRSQQVLTDSTGQALTGGDGKVIVTSRCPWCWLGFVANINLASFNADNLATFNKSVEGGIGLAVRLTSDFGIAVTYERVFSRRLKNFVQPGQPLVIDGETLTSISDDDNRFFLDDNLSAMSAKFVYLF